MQLATHTLTYRLTESERKQINAKIAMHVRNRDCAGQTEWGIQFHASAIVELRETLKRGTRTVWCKLPSAEFLARLEA